VKRPPKDECFRTSYTHGQLWLQYKPNCHQYIVCEPRGPGKYVKHIMSCGTTLYWNQKWHACSREKTGDCLDVSAITTTLPPTVAGESHGWIKCVCFECRYYCFWSVCHDTIEKAVTTDHMYMNRISRFNKTAEDIFAFKLIVILPEYLSPIYIAIICYRSHF